MKFVAVGLSYRSLLHALLCCVALSCSDGSPRGGAPGTGGTHADDGGQLAAGTGSGGESGAGGQGGESGEGGAGGESGAGGQGGESGEGGAGGSEPVSTCGNGEREGTEQCDDRNTDFDDGCGVTCRVETGWVCPEPGEPCESVCGDGVVRADELCDDENDDDEDYCSNDCSVSGSCGDGTRQAGANEQCDDGNTLTEVCAYGEESCSICTEICQLSAGAVSYCGDGVTLLSEDEQCDDGNAQTEACAYSATSCTVCDADCQEVAGATHECGDGETDAPDEQCDDGNATTEACAYGLASCTVCNATCQNAAGAVSSCGDSFVDINHGEDCEDGNTATESCDYGETSCSVCGELCTTIAGATSYCGDEETDRDNGEECDDADVDPLDGCDACMVVAIPECGNDVIDEALGENCDDGEPANFDGCNAACQREPGWTCDNVGEPCEEICGDGMTVGDEACDDDNDVDDDYCSNDCATLRFCGDDEEQANEAEQCDDGNDVTESCDYGETSCTVCDATCQEIAGAVRYCGNAVHDESDGEECDEGGATETCRADCRLQRYCILELDLDGEYQVTSTLAGLGDGIYPQSGGVFKMRLPDDGTGAPGEHASSVNRAGVLYYNMPVMFQKVIPLLPMTINTNVTSTAGTPTNLCPLNRGTLAGSHVSWLSCPYRAGNASAGHCTTDWNPTHQNTPEITPTAGCLPLAATGVINCTGTTEACALGALMSGDNPVDDSWFQPQNTAQFSEAFTTSVMNGLGGPTDCPITDPSRVGSTTYTNKLETPEHVTSRGWISTSGTLVTMTCDLLPADCDP